MTSPYSRPLPPLTSLPDPQRLPEESTSLVPPGEIIAESKAEIRRRLLRILWAPALVLLGLWYLLLTLYVGGTSPIFWLLSLLAGLAEPSILRSTVLGLGFTPDGIGTAYLLVPAAATFLSLLPALLAPSAVAGLLPQHFLTEQAFQRAVTTRVTATLMLMPVLAVLLLPVTVLLEVPQPWSGLGAGPLSAWCLGIAALQVAWVLVRRLVTAPTLLGIPDAAALATTARIDPDLERRAAAAAQVQAQDRRHLPPNLGTPALNRAATPRGALLALGLIARSSLVRVLPTATGLGWIIFGITDVVTVISRLSTNELTDMTSPLRWQQLVVVAGVSVPVVLALAFTPALAVMLSASQRERVDDLRTHESWIHRARVNRWESRAVELCGWLGFLWVFAGAVVIGVLLGQLQISSALTGVWVAAALLVLAPLQGYAADTAMRTGLRDVLYGPAGDYMRRKSPYVLVAPDVGTRSDRAKDPAVRAALRRRLQGDADAHALEIFDLDAAGERLWVDDSEPGATDTAVREADLARGRLPDFGGEGSSFTGGGQEPAEFGESRHGIPDSVSGLRDLRD